MQVVKRDGSIVAFDRSKIVAAIRKANSSVDEEDRIDQKTIEAMCIRLLQPTKMLEFQP